MPLTSPTAFFNAANRCVIRLLDRNSQCDRNHKACIEKILPHSKDRLSGLSHIWPADRSSKGDELIVPSSEHR
jgi:hypothetical protein